MTVEIPLTKNQIALVDDCDADLAEFKWYAHWKPDIQNYYARRSVGKWPKQQCLLMHRVIMERMINRPLLRHEWVDHIRHNTLDNRRSELRVASSSQSNSNKHKQNKTSSRFKGVYWNKQRSMWLAQIQVNYKRIHLGYFLDEYEAAMAYDYAALHYFGEFASLNIDVFERIN